MKTKRILLIMTLGCLIVCLAVGQFALGAERVVKLTVPGCT